MTFHGIQLLLLHPLLQLIKIIQDKLQINFLFLSLNPAAQEAVPLVGLRRLLFAARLLFLEFLLSQASTFTLNSLVFESLAFVMMHHFDVTFPL